MPIIRFYLIKIRQQNTWFIIGYGLAIVLIGLIWFIWQRYGDHELITPLNLGVTSGLIGLNLFLTLVALPRDAYASFLLLGATVVGEGLVITFLYRV